MPEEIHKKILKKWVGKSAQLEEKHFSDFKKKLEKVPEKTLEEFYSRMDSIAKPVVKTPVPGKGTVNDMSVVNLIKLLNNAIFRFKQDSE